MQCCSYKGHETNELMNCDIEPEQNQHRLISMKWAALYLMINTVERNNDAYCISRHQSIVSDINPNWYRIDFEIANSEI